jgi:hypothetical protein
MTREQWLRVKAITAAALEQPEAKRGGFVADSLLSSAVTTSPLFEAPVFAAASAVNVIEPEEGAAAEEIGHDCAARSRKIFSPCCPLRQQSEKCP